MKPYSDYAYASISMSRDEHFIKSLYKTLKEFIPRTILESGTFMGLGSTDLLAKTVLHNNLSIENFFTIEVDYHLYRIAKHNLRKYKFITPLWGMSVSRKEAIEFIKADAAIKEHQNFPDIFIDDLKDPVAFYINEINGYLSISKKIVKFSDRVIFNIAKPFHHFKQNLFDEILPKIRNSRPLILLDSAGGVGLLEFQKVLHYLAGTEYLIILDDVYHLKHFRSRELIENSPEFKILSHNKAHGWLIAHHL